jgi:hypothetical protein
VAVQAAFCVEPLPRHLALAHRYGASQAVPLRSLRSGRQLHEGLGDGGEELLGAGFVLGGAALVVLLVAQGGLGVGLGAVQEVALMGQSGLSLGSLEIHEGHVEAS